MKYIAIVCRDYNQFKEFIGANFQSRIPFGRNFFLTGTTKYVMVDSVDRTRGIAWDSFKVFGTPDNSSYDSLGDIIFHIEQSIKYNKAVQRTELRQN